MNSAVTNISRASTYCFSSSEEGERLFNIVHNRIENDDNNPSFIYSRLDNPNMNIVENKLALCDEMDKSLLFSSGMGAISTTCLALLKQGDSIIFIEPLYGGSSHFFRHVLPRYGINCISINCNNINISDAIKSSHNLKMIFFETPCNPLLKLISIASIHEEIKKHDGNILLAIDNTMCGPIFLKPKQHGAYLIFYSVTKFIGGHSDLLAGSVSANSTIIQTIKNQRTILGNIPDPFVCWLIERSLHTLRIRMEKQRGNALCIVNYLWSTQQCVSKIYYPSKHEDKLQ